MEAPPRGEPTLERETWTPLVLTRGLLGICQNTRSFEGARASSASM